MKKAQALDVPEEGILALKPKMVFGPGRHLTIFPIEQGTVSELALRFREGTDRSLRRS